ncbi:MAG: hypothetical protein CVV64_05545 [Candidatus Wallbacteria bacterium HGW-Wallbacteria-1]|jgi:DNA-binding transcriptional MerR regulator|uniref:HTH merR-type domain-containing protein n=1 Tax=Candidatus Wallbacteria bacterium HGW-Wallbacteria-1 TaxID=2013854 RepID=A0A2N1PSB6_9BACT|nr:MAG: hypothetical protein CVV64_05545 [Candidatus Wallbacteria bacterium HGW-Wallbacteria-1]
MKEYSLSEVLEELKISENTLRNYIKVFHSFFAFKRGEYNRIIFTEKDLETLRKICHHNKVEKISTKYVKRMLKNESDSTAVEKLKSYFEERIDGISKGINEINKRIEIQQRLLLNLMNLNSKVEEKISLYRGDDDEMGLRSAGIS